MEATIEEIKAAKTEADFSSLLEKYKYTFEKQLHAYGDDQLHHVSTLLEAAVSSGNREVVMLFTKAAIETHKIDQHTWKSLFGRILASMLIGKVVSESERDDSVFHYGYYECFGIALAEGLLYQTKANNQHVLHVLHVALRSSDDKLFYFARGLVTSLPLSDSVPIATQATQQLADEFCKYVREPADSPKPSTIAWERLSRFSDVAVSVSSHLATFTTLTELYQSTLPHIFAVFTWLNAVLSDYRVSFQNNVYKSVLTVIFDGLAAGAIENVRVFEPFVNVVAKHCEAKDEQLRVLVRDILAIIAEHEPCIVSQQLDFLLDCLAEDSPFLSTTAQLKILEFAPARVLTALPKLVTAFVWKCPRWQRRSNLLPLLTAVAQHSPNLIKDSCVEAVFELYEKFNEYWQDDKLLFALAAARPHDVARFDCFIKRVIIGYGRQECAKAAALLLTRVATSLAKADEYVLFISALLNVQWFRESDSLHFLKCILAIGDMHPGLRRKHYRLFRNCRSKVRCYSESEVVLVVVDAKDKPVRKRTAQDNQSTDEDDTASLEETKKRKLRSGKMY